MNKNGHLAYSLMLLLLIGCNVKAVNTDGGLISNHQNQKNEFTLITSLNQNYINGDTIVFILSFPKPVDVTGVPSFTFDVGGNQRSASYVSGTGTNQLHFEYSVSGTDLDTDGITVTSGILIDAGETIVYDGNMLSGLSINAPNLSSVRVNATP